LAPILISFARSVVSVQPRIGSGSTSCRGKLARLQAGASSRRLACTLLACWGRATKARG
jgi:hypothetical protein